MGTRRAVRLSILPFALSLSKGTRSTVRPESVKEHAPRSSPPYQVTGQALSLSKGSDRAGKLRRGRSLLQLPHAFLNDVAQRRAHRRRIGNEHAQCAVSIDQEHHVLVQYLAGLAWLRLAG